MKLRLPWQHDGTATFLWRLAFTRLSENVIYTQVDSNVISSFLSMPPVLTAVM